MSAKEGVLCVCVWGGGGVVLCRTGTSMNELMNNDGLNHIKHMITDFTKENLLSFSVIELFIFIYFYASCKGF